eukprot:171605-Lingulodinium_polyedra.AAC.1
MLFRRWEIEQGRLDTNFVNLACDASLQMQDDYLSFAEEMVCIPLAPDSSNNPLRYVTMQRRRKP